MATTFGRTLKELRERAGISQDALARRADVSRSTLARLETDKAIPSWPTVRALAKALGTTCQAFEVAEEVS